MTGNSRKLGAFSPVPAIGTAAMTTRLMTANLPLPYATSTLLAVAPFCIQDIIRGSDPNDFELCEAPKDSAMTGLFPMTS